MNGELTNSDDEDCNADAWFMLPQSQIEGADQYEDDSKKKSLSNYLEIDSDSSDSSDDDDNSLLNFSFCPKRKNLIEIINDDCSSTNENNHFHVLKKDNSSAPEDESSDNPVSEPGKDIFVSVGTKRAADMIEDSSNSERISKRKKYLCSSNEKKYANKIDVSESISEDKSSKLTSGASVVGTAKEMQIKDTNGDKSLEFFNNDWRENICSSIRNEEKLIHVIES